MTDQRFEFTVTAKSEGVAEAFSLDVSVSAPDKIAAVRKALVSAGEYAAMFPPDGTPSDWKLGK